MAKMGSIMAAGILDAGGRNVTIGLRSRSGYFRRTSVVGLAVFTQYWCDETHVVVLQWCDGMGAASPAGIQCRAD